MGGTGVIDRFLEVFTRYIDSGFGLLGGEVAFLATTLAAIDITLAAIFWSWAADEDIIARLAQQSPENVTLIDDLAWFNNAVAAHKDRTVP